MPLLCVPGMVAAFLLRHTVSYNCLYFSPVVNPLSKFIYLIEGQKRKVAYGWGGSYLLFTPQIPTAGENHEVNPGFAHG